MRSLTLLLVALAQSAVHGLTECQKCCSPGGDCSKASHGSAGVCCGEVDGVGYCCPAVTAKCWACASSYRCYSSGSRPSSSICAHDGGNAGRRRHDDDAIDSETVTGVVLFLSIGLLLCAVAQCRRRSNGPLAAQQGTMMMPPVGQPVWTSSTAMPVAKPGVPMAGGGSAIPVAQAVPAGTSYPAHAYPAGMYPRQVVGGYGGYGGGYGGGTVAAGAGMGFLGGMMMGEMMADAGHHGGDYGGDYGGGGGGDFGGGDGGFAADM